jgi:ferritin-like metal-binding protein YciE
MADTQLNERDAKLTQWLNEAYVKEAELEADLTAHIALTDKTSYKKRLQQHLKETRDHKRRVAARIKKLGGQASGPSVPGLPGAAGEAAGKAIAAVKGQIGAARATVTEQAETHLRNAQEELREEHVEIALYTRLEAFASEVGDRDTAQLARSVRRDEERMAKFLDAELKRLVKALVRAEIPRDQRAGTGRSRRRTSRSTSRSRTSSRSRSPGSTTRATSARGSSSSGRGSTSSRSPSGTSRSGSASRSGTSRSGSRSGTSRSGSRSRSSSSS